MHKCLIVKSDYCDSNWWNSCLCLDTMFGYVNLKIIKLLMLNFTCLWCIYMYTCDLSKIDEEWIVVDGFVDELMFDWCCCCYEVLLLMIHTLGVHNYGFVVSIELLLRVFVKMGWIDELCWNDIWFHVWCVFESSFEYMNL